MVLCARCSIYSRRISKQLLNVSMALIVLLRRTGSLCVRQVWLWENKFWLFERNLSHDASARQLNEVKNYIFSLKSLKREWKDRDEERYFNQEWVKINVLPSVWHVSSSSAIFLVGWREKTEQSPDYRPPGSLRSHTAWAVGGTWRAWAD